LGTTCASKAVFAGSANPRATPATKIIAYKPGREFKCVSQEMTAKIRVHRQETARVVRIIVRRLTWSAT